MHQPLTATAQLAGLVAANDNANAGGSIMSIGILLLIPLGMYFLLIRPQRRRAREQQALQKSIGVGDEVLTTSGIYGFVTAIETDSDVIWVEIDEDVQIRLTRGAISGKVNSAGGVDATASQDGGASDDGAEPADPAAAPAGRAKAAANRPSLKGTKAATTGTEGAQPGDE